MPDSLSHPPLTLPSRIVTRPRLLYLSHTLPYPPHQGVEIRALNTLRLLASRFDVTALCFHRFSDAPLLADALTALRPLADVRAFRIPQSIHRGRFAWDHLRSVLRRRVYTEYMYASAEFRDALTETLERGRFDVVHVESVTDLAGYLPMLSGVPVVGTHHNVESQLLHRRADVEGAALRRAYIRFQAGLMERCEAAWVGRIQLNVMVSNQDHEELKRRCGGGRFLVVPNGVDTDQFRPSAAEVDGIAFVGGSTWFPNRDALEYFAADILPVIRELTGSVRVRWIGRSTRADQQLFRERWDIELTGLVDDIRPLVAEAACFVVPLRVGGGTRLKILDGWALGKAIVSTSVGCEGLNAVDGENILIRDDVEGFARAVVDVLRDKSLRTRLAAAGRRTVEKEYSWTTLGLRLIPAVERIAGGLSDR